MPGIPWWWLGPFTPVVIAPDGPKLTPTQSEIQTLLRSFLLTLLPDGFDAVEGQDNLVAEPKAVDFAVFTPIRRRRLATNRDESRDTAFVGSITGNVLTITQMKLGNLDIGDWLFGPFIVSGTRVSAFGNGSGQAGTYYLNNSQDVDPETISAGRKFVMQETEITFQLDVHGPNSANNAQIISTAFRDEYATSWFSENSDTVSPLYADDPKQIPFINDQAQYENRWVIEAKIQADQTVILPQPYAETLAIELINVEATYKA